MVDFNNKESDREFFSEVFSKPGSQYIRIRGRKKILNVSWWLNLNFEKLRRVK